MVTKILKFLFLTNDAVQPGFPNVSVLLPEHLQKLYFDYYQSGSGGMTLFLLFLGVVLFALLCANTRERWFARVVILITLLLWPISLTRVIASTQVPLNVLFLPIPKLPMSIFLMLFLVSFYLAYRFFRKYCQKICRPSVVLFCDLAVVILFALIALPIWSGELWV